MNTYKQNVEVIRSAIEMSRNNNAEMRTVRLDCSFDIDLIDEAWEGRLWEVTLEKNCLETEDPEVFKTEVYGYLPEATMEEDPYEENHFWLTILHPY